jgi:excisionase family DNA binding protein
MTSPNGPEPAKRARPAYKRRRPNKKKWSVERVTLSPPESTRLTGFGLSNTYDMLTRHQMPGIRVGNRWYIPRTALLAWLEKTACAGLVERPPSAA